MIDDSPASPQLTIMEEIKQGLPDSEDETNEEEKKEVEVALKKQSEFKVMHIDKATTLNLALHLDFTVLGMILIPKEGNYNILLQSTGKHNFKGAAGPWSHFRVGFAKQVKKAYRICRREVSYTGTGIHYEEIKDEMKGEQSASPKFISDQVIVLEVRYGKDSIIIS